MFFAIILIGIVSACIGTLAGGGGLISLPAMMLFGIPIHTSIATNKFSSGIAALTSIIYLLRKKLLSIKLILVNVCLALAGGVVGAVITSKITENSMNITALILLLFAFVVLIMNSKWVSAVENKESERSSKQGFVIPILVAAYDGGFGPGSSTFAIIHYLTRNFSYIQAVQMTRVLIFGSCLGGFIVFYCTGFIEWDYAIAMAIGSAIGSQVGLRILPHIPLKVARNLLMVIISLLIIQMISRLVF